MELLPPLQKNGKWAHSSEFTAKNIHITMFHIAEGIQYIFIYT